MYSDWSVIVGGALAVIFIWIGFITFLVWRQNKFLRSIFPKSGERDIRKKFEELMETVDSFNNKLSIIEDKVGNIQVQGMQHIQKVELLRFNPFDDTGGDISFTLCLLNNHGSGIVITSLHTRSGTRVFGKEVIGGKGGKYPLSKEEESVILKAMAGKESYG